MEKKSTKNSKTSTEIKYKQLELFPEVPNEKKVDNKFSKVITSDVVKKLGLK